jgi:hypothetical protein
MFEKVLEIIYNRINQLENEINSFLVLSNEIDLKNINSRIEELEDLVNFLIEMNGNESLDIRLLKLRIVLLIKLEEYEIANRIKNWIIELGGDPDISEYINSDGTKKI